MLIKKDAIPKVSNEVMNIIHSVEIDLVNKLYEAVLENDVKKVDKLLKEFIQEVEEHFSEEEEMMLESGYWGRNMHKAEHDTMREKLEKLKIDWEKDKNTEKIKEFLENEYSPWLNLHISRWDAETAMYLGDSY